VVSRNNRVRRSTGNDILCAVAGGVDRAKADLEAGNPRVARERLKGLLVAYPDDIAIRTMLAETYRQDRQYLEAGRWGYLFEQAASEREREAFERHCAFGWRRRITPARLHHLLRCQDLARIADAAGRERLRQLPRRRRRPWSKDGSLTALARRVAMFKAAITNPR
jgi:hypothetical protein